MAVNKFKPHLFVLPEDDANRQMAIGFEKDSRIRGKALQILSPAGGWRKAIDTLKQEYFTLLETNAKTHILLLIDCDEDETRIQSTLAEVPDSIKDRVFIVGSLTTPEKLRQALGFSFEKIGETALEHCFDQEVVFWQHDLLRHNKREVARLKESLFDVVFEGR